MNITGAFRVEHGIDFSILGWPEGAFDEQILTDPYASAERSKSSNPVWIKVNFDALRTWMKKN